MKKKLLALLLATTMSMALMACGGSKETATEEVATEETAEEEVVEEATGDYTEEQAAFVEEFNTMVADYNAVVDAANEVAEIVENQEVVDAINTVTEAIDEAAEIISDPANLTAEVMDSYRNGAFVETYNLIDSIQAVLDEVGTTEVSEEKATMQAVFTSALAGTDEVDNTYFFLCDDELTFGAFVVLSADGTQSLNVVGEITSREEDGALVITDEATSTYAAFTTVEQTDEYIVIDVEGANEVTLVNWDLEEAIDTVLAIDETTEILE